MCKQFFLQSLNTYLSHKKDQKSIGFVIFEINSLTFKFFSENGSHNSVGVGILAAGVGGDTAKFN